LLGCVTVCSGCLLAAESRDSDSPVHSFNLIQASNNTSTKMIRYLALLAAVASVLVITDAADALNKCYKCKAGKYEGNDIAGSMADCAKKDDKGLGIADAYKKDSNLVECLANEKCYKEYRWIGDDDKNWYVARGCKTGCVDKTEQNGDTVSGFGTNKVARMCCDDKDGCNGAGFLTINMALAAAMLLLSVAMRR